MNVCDAHIQIIEDDANVTGPGTIRSEQQETFEIFVRRAPALERTMHESAIAQLDRVVWFENQNPIDTGNRLSIIRALRVNLLQVAQNPRQNLSMSRRREHARVEASLATGDLAQPSPTVLDAHAYPRKRIDVDGRVSRHPDQKMAWEANPMGRKLEPLGHSQP